MWTLYYIFLYFELPMFIHSQVIQMIQIKILKNIQKKDIFICFKHCFKNAYLFIIYKISIARKSLNYLLSTWSWALLLAFPQVNSISPFMSIEVCFRISLCTAPIFSTRMQELDCKHSPFRLHTGVLTTGAETSHSKQASLGAVTSTSSSSLTTDRIWAASRHNRQGTFLPIMH